MRVAVWHNLPSGGGKRALYDHVRALVSRGHDVEAWCPTSADVDFLPLSDLVAEHVLPLAPAPDGVRVVLSELRNDRSAAIGVMDDHVAACGREISAGGFDVLLAGSCRSFRATGIARFVDLPSLLYLQEPYRPLYEAMPDPPFAADVRSPGWWHRVGDSRTVLTGAVTTRRRRLRVREETRNVRSFDRVLCNSRYSRESILRSFGVDAAVCYLGVDDRMFVPSPVGQERSAFFLTVGAAVPEKHLDLVIRAVGRSRHRDWPLVWVANTVDRAYLSAMEDLARGLGVSLDLRSRISDVEVVGLYQAAGLLLYAPRLEPFGLAPLEAAACGLPTVAVAEAGTRETIVDEVTGRLVDADPGAFAAAIDELVERPARRRELGLAGRREVEHRWTADAAGGRLEAALVDVVSAGRPAPGR